MDAYYVRVYTLNSGEKVEPAAIYAKYEQAENDLGCFVPSGLKGDASDLCDVSYMQVEKRFSPTPLWDIA